MKVANVINMHWTYYYVRCKGKQNAFDTGWFLIRHSRTQASYTLDWIWRWQLCRYIALLFFLPLSYWGWSRNNNKKKGGERPWVCLEIWRYWIFRTHFIEFTSLILLLLLPAYFWYSCALHMQCSFFSQVSCSPFFFNYSYCILRLMYHDRQTCMWWINSSELGVANVSAHAIIHFYPPLPPRLHSACIRSHIWGWHTIYGVAHFALKGRVIAVCLQRVPRFIFGKVILNPFLSFRFMQNCIFGH